jgi:tryptophan synthase alpha subunit
VDLKDFVARIRAITDKHLAVGFGISTPEHVRIHSPGGHPFDPGND